MEFHDFLAIPQHKLDQYEIGELEPSFATQLDTVGMQPHAREYLEREMSCLRSGRKLQLIDGQVMDYAPGIQFSGRP